MKRSCQYFIGTSGWSYTHWQPTFYPADLPKSHWFEYYTKYFNAVEINATFYHRFRPSVYEKWYRQAPGQFRYVLKVPQSISHYHYLKNIEIPVRSFIDEALLLHEKLGGLLLQLSPKMPFDLDRLEKTLHIFSGYCPIVVEFRHPQWLVAETQNLLKKTHSIFCHVDSPDQSLKHRVNSSLAYIRLHGHHEWYEDNYTSVQLKKIAAFARELEDHGAKKIFIFFNNDASGYAVKNALSLKELLL